MRYSLHHKTVYSYSSLVSYSHHLAHFCPLETPHQRVSGYELTISPESETHTMHRDYFGNATEYFSVISPHDQLEINAYSEIEVTAPTVPSLDLSSSWESVAERMKNPVQVAELEASEFSYASQNCPLSAEIAEYAKASFRPGTKLLKAALDFNEQIHEEFSFDPQATTVTSSVESVFEKKAGVCQDFAHFQISALRSLGLAAKYVSGYLRTDPPPGKPRLIGADASHAWISLYVPEIGWVEYDSTNNLIPSTDHITVAYGRDYHDICPIRGIVYGGGSQTLEVGVTVSPL